MFKLLSSFFVNFAWLTLWLLEGQPVVAAVLPSVITAGLVIWALFAPEYKIRAYGTFAMRNKQALNCLNGWSLVWWIVMSIVVGFVPVLIAALVPTLVGSITQLIMIRRVGWGY